MTACSIVQIFHTVLATYVERQVRSYGVTVGLCLLQ